MRASAAFTTESTEIFPIFSVGSSALSGDTPFSPSNSLLHFSTTQVPSGGFIVKFSNYSPTCILTWTIKIT